MGRRAHRRTVHVPKSAKTGGICVAQRLRELGADSIRGQPMPHRKRHARAIADQHRQTLLAVLYLASVLLLINAWLVSHQLISF
jgi:hypothetical protein